jgi:hypothetical protein
MYNHSNEDACGADVCFTFVDEISFSSFSVRGTWKGGEQDKLLIEAIVLQRKSLAEDFENAMENRNTKSAFRRWDIIGESILHKITHSEDLNRKSAVCVRVSLLLVWKRFSRLRKENTRRLASNVPDAVCIA